MMNKIVKYSLPAVGIERNIAVLIVLSVVCNAVRKTLLLITLTAGLLSTSFYASATGGCSAYAGASFPYDYYLDYGSITVQRDTPIGTVIGTATISPAVPGGYFSCSSGTVINIYNSLFTEHSTRSYVYNTNIPGVGIREYTLTSWLPMYSALQIMIGGKMIGDAGMSDVTKYVLVKTGPIASGTYNLSTGRLAYMNSSDYGDLFRVNIRGGTITSVACTIATPVVSVRLEDVLGSSLTAVNSVANPKDFNVGLDCDAGARVNVTMAGTKNIDTTAVGVLQLTGAGTAGVAKGVGIQILYNNAPVAVNGSTPLVLGTSAGGQTTYSFTAQYYQTKSAASVTTGSANAMVTMNITYQ
jgi:type 1 fimbria pilin